jgi:hypothetical protein
MVQGLESAERFVSLKIVLEKPVSIVRSGD